MPSIKKLTIGIDDYCFTMANSCSQDEKKALNLCMSLQLEGSFLPAGKSDLISDTIDYEALCLHIEKQLGFIKCSDLLDIKDYIIKEILSISPLISGGYFSLQAECHRTFTIESSLVM